MSSLAKVEARSFLLLAVVAVLGPATVAHLWASLVERQTSPQTPEGRVQLSKWVSEGPLTWL